MPSDGTSPLSKDDGTLSCCCTQLGCASVGVMDETAAAAATAAVNDTADDEVADDDRVTDSVASDDVKVVCDEDMSTADKDMSASDNEDDDQWVSAALPDVDIDVAAEADDADNDVDDEFTEAVEHLGKFCVIVPRRRTWDDWNPTETTGIPF